MTLHTASFPVFLHDLRQDVPPLQGAALAKGVLARIWVAGATLRALDLAAYRFA